MTGKNRGLEIVGSGPSSNGNTSTELWPAPSQPMLVAERLAELNHTHDGILTLRRWRGTWIVWDGSGAWRDVEEAGMRKDVYDTLRDAKYWHPKEEDQPWAPNRSKVANVLEALDAVTHLPGHAESPSWIDDGTGPAPGQIVACRNGLLHVTTRELHDHDPRYLTRAAVPFDYDPDAPEPSQWLGFLHQLWPRDPDAIATLQEWFGYVLSGSTAQQKILLLIGPKRSGKGTIARVLQLLVGKGNYANPTMASLAENFGLANLLGKPLAVISDARLGKGDVHKTTERLLSISGEDGIDVDRKYKEAWNGQIPARFMVLTNELPNFGETSDAIAGRFVIVKMTTSWFGQENHELTEGLATELPGILRWALDGLRSLNLRGRFVEPKSSEGHARTLRLMGPVQAFVEAKCDVGEPCDECHRLDPGLEMWVAKSKLFETWGWWARDNGEQQGGASEFGRRLLATDGRIDTGKRGRKGEQKAAYLGVRLCSSK